MKGTTQEQQTMMDLDTEWYHGQLADAHEVCDKLEQENGFLRAEFVKHGFVLEADDEHSFALGGVPNQPGHSSVSFTESATYSQPGTADGKPRASETSESFGGMAANLLSVARQSDAACSELQQMIDRLQSRLTATTSDPSPMASRSPFAAVAAGSQEDEVKATKKLCGEASSQAVEVRTHLNSLIEALQEAGAVNSTPDRVNSDSAPDQLAVDQRDQAPPPPPAGEHSFDIRSAVPPSNSFAGVRRSLEAFPSKSKLSVSFQTLDQPAYSANLDSFLPGSRALEHEMSSLSDDYDTSQMGNPLFDSTMSHERVEGTRGVALTRASVAAQMMQNLSHADAESQSQLAEAVNKVQQQVSTSIAAIWRTCWQSAGPCPILRACCYLCYAASSQTEHVITTSSIPSSILPNSAAPAHLALPLCTTTALGTMHLSHLGGSVLQNDLILTSSMELRRQRRNSETATLTPCEFCTTLNPTLQT